MAKTRAPACDACHKRKIQCHTLDNGEQCNWCQHHQLTCTYDRPRGRKVNPNSRARTQSSSTFAKRLAAIEERIDQVRASRDEHLETPEASGSSEPWTANPSPAEDTTNSLVSPTSPTDSSAYRPINNPQGQIYFSGQNFGTVSAPDGIPKFTAECERWIHSRTAQWPQFGTLCEADGSAPFSIVNPRPSTLSGAGTNLGGLPEKCVSQYLTEVFFRSGFSRCFPFIDRVLFKETIEIAYSTPNDSNIEYIRAKACVLAFVAIASFSLTDVEPVPHMYIDRDACITQTQRLLSDLLEDVSITTLQTILMLAMNKAHGGHFQASGMYHAVACRIVFALGGHTLLPIPVRGRELTRQEHCENHIRMLFWLCYIFDKDGALRSAQPPIIADEFCNLTLPEGYPETIFGDRSDQYSLEDITRPYLVSDLRLVLLKSKVAKGLYSFTYPERSNAELLQKIRELDDELENWRLSIPARYAPPLSVRKDFKLVKGLSKCATMLHIDLHLGYHHTLSIIHNASSRCVVDSHRSGREETFGVRSSLELSVEASRSTIIFLSEAAPRLAGEAFWIFVFYPVSAFVSLFFNILRNPDHIYAAHDIELLSTAADIIRNMPMVRVTAEETAYLRKAVTFIAELGRLAKCAVAKWHDEQGIAQGACTY